MSFLFNPKVLFKFFIYSVLLSYIQASSVNDTKLHQYFYDFLFKFSNATVREQFYKGECEGNVTRVFSEAKKLMDIVYKNGKFVDDWGDYTQCIKSDELYTLMRFNYTVGKQVKKGLIGLCFLKQCKEYIEYLIYNATNANKSTVLLDYFSQTYGFTVLPDETKYFTQQFQYKIKKTSFSFGFKIIIFCLHFFIVIKFGFSLFGYFYFKKSNSQYLTTGSINDINGESVFETSNVCIQCASKTGNQNPHIKKMSYRIYANFSYLKSIKYLLAIKSKLYNDQDLDKFYFVKTLTLIGINFHTLLISYAGRTINIEEVQLSQMKYFFLYKLSYYSHNAYILVVGFIFSYKLLSYIAKKDDSDLKTFLKFYSICFSRFFIYYLAAFIVIYYSKEIYSFLGNYNIIEDRFVGKLNFNCYVNPIHLFIPLYLNYYNPSEYKQYLITEQCNNTFILLSAEFYIFTFSLIIFYFIFRFRSKKFEVLICSLPFIFLVSLFLKYGSNGLYTNKEVLFAIRKVLKPHSLFVPYFFGIIVGIIYFINNHTFILVSESVYIPFKFFSAINILLYKRSVLLLQIISYFFLCCALLVSFNYNLICYLYPVSRVEAISVQFDLFLNIVYLYEQKIFVFFIALYLIVLIHRDNYVSKDQTRSSLVHLAISRSAYCIILISDVVSDLVYIKILVWIRHVNNLNLILFCKFANFLLTFLISLFFKLSLELPFRNLIKSLSRDRKEL